MQLANHPGSVFRLTALAFLTHAADQLALAALPLVAVLLFAATPSLIGTLVAVQSAAWLFMSLPMGVVIDRAPLSFVIRGALALGMIGATMAGVAVWAEQLIALALASFVLASGTVIFVMAQVASLPALVARADLGAANARLETARASAMFAAPFIAGWCVSELPAQTAYGLAALLALGGLILSFSIPLPAFGRLVERTSIIASIGEGARFVVGDKILRAIALCAIFWNIAFFGLIATFVPFALQHIGLSSASAGFALGANGVGLLSGAVLADPVMRRVKPSMILVAGPCLSLFGVILILTSPAVTNHPGYGLLFAACGFFIIGFGPMLWLIVQTSIRQLMTPPHLIARVTATIQTAIYGVRPLGALAAGQIGEAWGLQVALAFCAAGFAASVAVSGLSPLARMNSMPVVAP